MITASEWQPEIGAKTTWSCPSNIALVKYWGKKEGGKQLPANPSISWSLSDLCATTEVEILPKSSERLIFTFDHAPKPAFEPKLLQFLDLVTPVCPWLNQVTLKVNSTNNFPHGTGIASSAAGLGALATCLVALESGMGKQATVGVEAGGNAGDGTTLHRPMDWKKVSYMARLGSGSACRSMYGLPAVWGESLAVKGSSDQYAVELDFAIHPNLQGWEDCVLIVDAGEKSVSSTAGHALLKNHPYAEARFAQASENLTSIVEVFGNGDVKRFIEIVESEALQLHAMMQTSVPYYLLMRPNTLALIEKIWQYRESTGQAICFTLDAGANVHLLFDAKNKLDIMNFVETVLFNYCDNKRYLCSSLGGSPKES